MMGFILVVVLILLIIDNVNSFLNHKVYSNRNRKSILFGEIKPFSEEWARKRGMEPGYGGIRYYYLLNTFIYLKIILKINTNK
jgi:hypothetical protein